jgi:hypothetical protein
MKKFILIILAVAVFGGVWYGFYQIFVKADCEQELCD